MAADMNLPPARTNTLRNTSLRITAVVAHRTLALPVGLVLSLETLPRFSIQCSFSKELPNEDPYADDAAGLLPLCSAVRIEKRATNISRRSLPQPCRQILRRGLLQIQSDARYCGWLSPIRFPIRGSFLANHRR